MSKAKPYLISKYAVLEAYKHVKANKGTAGIDGVSMTDFERDIKNNLYKIWNRMSSGSYLPPPVKAVEISKEGGGIRKLGVPTISDRVAQMVVKMYLEPLVEPVFHENSYGYRPRKAALDAVEIARKRCWKYDWVIDLDIKGFFDNIDHELMMHAVRKHTQEPWILLYVQRWLKAPIQETNGCLVERNKGTPQGGVISPLLANMFLHYAFDAWMEKNFPLNPFERYADDIVVHCKTEVEAKNLKEAIKVRLQKCKLELHPEKTKIVYCKDSNRPGSGQNESFDFLGYTFRPRSSRNRWGKLFVNFSPAISDKATKKIKEAIKLWIKEVKPTGTLEEIAKIANPQVIGWINYYGKFHMSELWKIIQHMEMSLMKWAQKKYEKLKRSCWKAKSWLLKNKERRPTLFKHWQWMHKAGLNGRAV